MDDSPARMLRRRLPVSYSLPHSGFGDQTRQCRTSHSTWPARSRPDACRPSNQAAAGEKPARRPKGDINGLSTAHRDFLAAGGNGLLIGDGQLNYRTERILESYYAIAIDKGLTLSADYQFIDNPAYNADRGPVSIFSGRLHGEF